MLKSIFYFVDDKGNNPVKEFIAKLTIKERAKIFAYLIELKDQGHNLRRPMADYLGNGIYELRPKNNRIFYFFFLKEGAVLVHAIRKKTNAIPAGDLELCIKRKRIIEGNKKTENIEFIGGNIYDKD